MGPVYDGEMSAVGYLNETLIRHVRIFNGNCGMSLESKRKNRIIAGCKTYLHRRTVHFAETLNQHTNQCTYIKLFILTL